MSQLSLHTLPALSAFAASVRPGLIALQEKWPSGISLRIGRGTQGTASELEPTVVATLPFILAEHLGIPTDRDDLRRLGLAGQLYSGSLVLMDDLIDRRPSTCAPLVLNAQAMQFEAYRILGSLFSKSDQFWSCFGAYLSEYTAACSTERALAAERFPWPRCDHETLRRIVLGKNGMVRTAVAGVAVIAQAADALSALEESVTRYFAACQVLDDIQDWREDFQLGLPSGLLYRLGQSSPVSGMRESEVGRLLYYDGHVSAMLSEGLEDIRAAQALASKRQSSIWLALLTNLRNDFETLRRDLDKMVERNRERNKSARTIRLSADPRITPASSLAHHALDILLIAWRQGFGEARHIMRFPKEGGFRSDEIQAGDVFQRAIVADALLDARELGRTELTPVIESECDHILSCRRDDEVGGWSYFPELVELAPDADDLAQIMQVLWRAGRYQAVRDYCIPALVHLFNTAMHDDGSFETWILPPAGSPHWELQARFVREKWGRGSDPEVLANVVIALSVANAEGFAEYVPRALQAIRSRQESDGSWLSTWYHGPYYGTWMCVRALCTDRRNDLAIRRSFDFLLSRQRDDGGWSIAGESRALETALALSTLMLLPAHKGVQSAAARGIDFLLSDQDTLGALSNLEWVTRSRRALSNAARLDGK